MSHSTGNVSQDSAEYRYLLWRTVKSMAAASPGKLNGVDTAKAERQAKREYALIHKALSRPDAAALGAGDEIVDDAVNAMEAEYASAEAFEEELSAWGLDRERLRQAVASELRAGMLLDRVAGAASVGQDEVRAYYDANRERMVTPEVRGARQILITVNEQFEENRPQEVRRRIEELATELEHAPEEFENLALRHSECPSALEKGWMGRIRRGQLYPELEQVLFELGEGEISGPVESPLGLHLVRCDSIDPARQLDFAEVAPRIRTYLENRKRKQRVKHWLECENPEATQK